MKVFYTLLLVSYFVSNNLVLGKPEAPAAAAPYPPRGWKPSGPSFELPNETAQPESEYGPASPESNVEVTEEEVEYTGEIGTTEGSTRANEYGPPSASAPSAPGDTTTGPEDDLSVQGLPSSEPAKEFRTLPSRLRNQRVRVQQTSARLQTRPGSQQFFQGTQFQKSRANTQFSGFSGSLRLAPQRPNQFNQFQQFGAPVQSFGIRTQPIFSQRLRSQKQQEAPVDSYGAPASGVSQPASTYGAPQSEYGSPEPVGQQPGEETEPDAPPTGSEETTEPNDVELEEEGGPSVAVSNSLATGRYILVQQQNPKTQKLRIIQAGAAKIRAQPVMQPIYTVDQFGQFVRVL